jgi:hypothetical protein
MNSIAVRILAAVSIIEAIIIAWLIATGTHIVIKNQLSSIPAESPISLATDYDAPNERFEQVVKQNLGWLPYHFPEQSLAILAKCAYEKRTNYVRILIENGADVQEAVRQLKKIDQEEAVNLLKQLQIEVKDKRAGVST